MSRIATTTETHLTSGCHINVSSEALKGIYTPPPPVELNSSPIAADHLCVSLPLIITIRTCCFDGRKYNNSLSGQIA